MYTPGLTPLVGRVITPYLLWRLMWILPLAIALGWLGLGAIALARRYSWKLWIPVAILAVIALDLPRAAGRVNRVLHLRFNRFESRVEMAGRLRDRLQAPTRVLTAKQLHGYVMAVVPNARTLYWRQRADPERHELVTAFLEARRLDGEQLAVLDEFRPQYLALRDDTPVLRGVRRQANGPGDPFELVEQVQEWSLYRVRGRWAPESERVDD
jgi:hypothetical protein